MDVKSHLRDTYGNRPFAYGALTGDDVKILTDGPVLTGVLTEYLRRLTGQLWKQCLQNVIPQLLTGTLT